MEKMKQTEGDRAAFEKLHPLETWEIRQLGEPVARAIQWQQRQIKDEWQGFKQGWQASRLATVREIAEWLRQESRESGSIRLDNKADDLLAREAQSRERC